MVQIGGRDFVNLKDLLNLKGKTTAMKHDSKKKIKQKIFFNKTKSFKFPLYWFIKN